MTQKNDCWEKAARFIAAGDDAEAERLCLDGSCSASCVRCQAFLGWRNYQRGDLDAARQWFSRAAAEGHADAVYGLATVAMNGGRYEEAADLFRKSLMLGCTRSNYWLGVMHEHGLGLRKSLDEALRYYRAGTRCGYIAAERAHIQALLHHGSFIQRLSAFFRCMSVIAKGFTIALKDPNDERLADVPKTWPGSRAEQSQRAGHRGHT